MKKADIILISILICVFVIFLSFYLFRDTKGAVLLIIQQDNEIIYKEPIEKDNIIQIYDVSGNLINTVTVDSGVAYMSFATCPNKDCIHMGEINAGSKKQIACLPNKVLVYLISKDSYLDGVTK